MYRRGPTKRENGAIWASARKIWGDDAHAEIHAIMGVLWNKKHMRELTPSQVDALRRIVVEGEPADKFRNVGPSADILKAVAAARHNRFPGISEGDWKRFVMTTIGTPDICTQADARRILITIRNTDPAIISSAATK